MCFFHQPACFRFFHPVQLIQPTEINDTKILDKDSQLQQLITQNIDMQKLVLHNTFFKGHWFPKTYVTKIYVCKNLCI